MAAQVVLVFGVVVALVEAVGVATVGEVFQIGQQTRIERTTGDRVVNGTTIGLAGARNVVGALGAAFDLQRVDTDLGQPMDVFDGTQILGIHDVGAVLVFLDRHQFAGALAFFEQDFLLRAVVKIDRLAGRQGGAVGSRHLVVPAAGIGTGALIGVAVVEVAGEQAAAGIGNA